MFTKVYEKFKEFIKSNYKGIITLIVIYFIFTIELPYSIYTPGGAVNLNDRITIDDSYQIDGSFNMAYVSMVKGSLPFVLISKVIPDWDLVKKNDITAYGENMKELLARERLYLEESIASATINAYKAAKKEIEITDVLNEVSYIASDADTNLVIGDVIKSIDKEKISSLEHLKEVVNTKKVDAKLDIKVLRDDKEVDAYAKVYDTSDGKKIGVSIVTTYEYEADPKIDVKRKATEAGSSGGLMMSLTIYNMLVEEDITHGKRIVGTGTIDINGKVGEIGGVKYKLIGAVKNKAEIFICPEENYEEAKKVADERDYDIKIISAKTFLEALEKLEEFSF